MIDRTCLIEGCEKAAFRRGWCTTHWKRWQRHGDPTKTVRFQPVEDRFWSKVDRRGTDECWPWLAGISQRSGYGGFRFNGSTTTAHRIAYELSVGPIPDGLHIDHLCRNRACVNPAHLEPVTIGENIRRGLTGAVARARQINKTHCPQGHPYDITNTYRDAQGRRGCRACRRQRTQERQARKRQEKVD